MTAARLWWLVAVLALAASACAEGPVCKPGDKIVAGECVAGAPVVCGPGTVKDAATGKCVLAADAAAGDGGAQDAGPADAGVADSTAGDATAPDTPQPDTATTDASEAPCVPVCAAADACGDDGCGGTCGTCSVDKGCIDGICQSGPDCQADCTDKLCGEDGCGGVCGTCNLATAPVCQAGKCVAQCIPNCFGKVCGTDSCGGSCGACLSGMLCTEGATCVPATWTCDPAKYAAEDQCDCGCGVIDPDCGIGSFATLGCQDGEVCTAGKCVAIVPAAWKCEKPAYGNGGICDCGCGAVDPDCKVADAPLAGCKFGEKCAENGSCGPCKPDCAGKICGDDGCGGFCGACPKPKVPGDPKLACVGGKCVDGCVPKPVLCVTNTCGSDGCGSTCGTCKPDTFCKTGNCETEPGKSCEGFCKGKAPGGCSCMAGCLQKGDCCPDFVGTCTCAPKCQDKACGADGCGGTCGTCLVGSGKPYCGNVGQCSDMCGPQCLGKVCGDDGCGGKCGTCAIGEVCSGNGKCVPAAWNCPHFYYADNSACDCACGAPDPDCSKIALTLGCPLGVGCDKTTGYCNIPYCNANGQCTTPKWCVGHWPVGGGLRKGVCKVPNPAGKGEGVPCATDSTCAASICAGGRCRMPCQLDGDCGTGKACVGIPVAQPLTGKPMGVVAVCEGIAKLGEACTSHKACGVNRLCLAVIAPATLQAKFRCGSLPSATAIGAKCAGPGTCAVGLVCVGSTCRPPCPAGTGECPAGLVCGKGVLHGGVSSASIDDVTTPTCVPK